MLQRRTQSSLGRTFRFIQQIVGAHRRRMQLFGVSQHPLLRLKLRVFVLGGKPAARISPLWNRHRSAIRRPVLLCRLQFVQLLDR